MLARFAGGRFVKRMMLSGLPSPAEAGFAKAGNRPSMVATMPYICFRIAAAIP